MGNIRPTREQYLKNIEYMQQKELNSEVFKNAYNIVQEYSNRENSKLEYNFYKLFKKFEQQFEKLKYYNGDLCRTHNYYSMMCNFINELPDEVISSNYVLKSAKEIISKGYVEALACVKEFVSQVENYDGSYRYEVEIPLSSELSECLLDWMIISVRVATPEEDKNPYRYVDVLPDDCVDCYYKYNELSQKMNAMIGKILNYQMFMILSTFPYKTAIQLPAFSSMEDGKRNIHVDFLRLRKCEKSPMRELKSKN